MTIRAVLFDYAGVMTEEIRPALHRLAESSGAEPAEVNKLLLGDYGGGAGSSPWHQVERGEIPLDELVAWGREQGATRGWTLDLSVLMVGFMELPIRPAMTDKARDLRRRGYRTALVTNNVRELESQWRGKLPVDELFDEVVDSSAVGLRKPEPAIFALTLERLGVPAGQAVLLDDMSVNLAAAREFGMDAIRVEADAAPALEELDRLLAAV